MSASMRNRLTSVLMRKPLALVVVVPFFTLGIISLHCEVKRGDVTVLFFMSTTLNHIRVFFISLQIVIVFKNLVLS